jgi:hypothetical protein
MFILGAIAGAVGVWLWRRELERYVGDGTRRVRARAVAGLQAIDEKAGQVLDDTKQHVSDALRAGQEAIR